MPLPSHPLEFHGPAWHCEGQTPVVDDKYYDRATGEIRHVVDGEGGGYYMGPPSVDIIIQNLHEGGFFRAARASPIGPLLCHIMKIIGEKKLNLDSVTATTYTIRLTLAHALPRKEFNEIAVEMIWGQKE